MEFNELLYAPHVAWGQTLGNYKMVCTIEERRDRTTVLVVTENGQELERAEFPAPERGDFAGAMAAWDAAWKLREKYYQRALEGMQPEFNRLRPR
jgi:hypothetical protein